MAKKVLVTGAGGFIGSHLVEKLVRDGCSVRAFVSYRSDGTSGWLSDLPNEVSKEVEIFRGDIRDPNGCQEALKDCGSMFHLAALIGIPYSYHSPDSYVDTNIKGTLNLLQAARKFSLEKVICTSTSEVYGTAQKVPIDESHPIVGQSPYSASKIGSDQMAISFFRSFGFPVVVVRPFNTYGPRQSNRAIIPTILSQAASGSGVVKVGSSFPTRDFVYVGDTVKGFDLAMKNGKGGETYNLATGFEISVGQLVQLASEVVQKKLLVESEDLRVRPKGSEVERLCGDYRKAQDDLKWIPEKRDLEGLRSGMQKYVDWFKKQPLSSNYISNYQI